MAECLPECMENSTLQVELEILESIYLDELQVEHDDSGNPRRVEITLHPATADNVEAQFVRLTLSIILPKQYPQELPSLTIQNPRGLSEQQVNSLYKSLQHLAQERQGESMLYEIIELAKDSLTHNNLPSCECAICLYPFHEMDDFTKTECYHYFHCHCLGRYIQHTLDQEPEVTGPVDPGRVETPQNEVVCPMCREPISYDLAGLLSAKPPAINEDKYKPDKAMIKWQADMAKVYKKQQSKGGIIDIEAEKNKFFIKLEAPRREGDSTSDVVSVGTEESQEDPTGGELQAGIGVMATVKTEGISKAGNGEMGATGMGIAETTRLSDRKPQSAGSVPRDEDGKRRGIPGEMEKGQQRRHEGERKVRSAGRGAGRYQARRHSPREGWRDRSKGGERRQYREGRRSPGDGQKMREQDRGGRKSPGDVEKVREQQKKGNEETKLTGKQGVNNERAMKRDGQRPYPPRKGDSRKDDDFDKPEQSIASVADSKGSEQSTRSDKRRDEVRSHPSRSEEPRHGEEAGKKHIKGKGISTRDSRQSQAKSISASDSSQQQEGKKSYQNGFPELRNENRSITSTSSEHCSDRYHNQQYKSREGDHPKKTSNRPRQQDWQRRNRRQQDGRRTDETKKGYDSNKVVDKKQTKPPQMGSRNEKEDRKLNKSDHSAAIEVQSDVRTVSNDKRHDPKPRGPPPGFEKVKKSFTRPPPGFDDFR
ncbi:PREDICTED: E3 ubiquitin-protein ligase RNF25-like [Branchiostoma belcheri]|uniref:E3 ubiquitin-protein ligase RNF25 n=1 Tax=Branchiostoma belcheri TaxID=7741 RepID=A0A6P5AKE7_BRABE|nr:PREDICTED: E3 ubiquitin-protein ligase RNF25-like [Branchiostoma belcheri]